MLKKWITLSQKAIAKSMVFNHHQFERHSAIDESKKSFFDVLKLRDCVIIIPINNLKKFICVRQYRHGIDDFTLEFPAGLIDSGESPLEAAIRELREETGYISENWHFLGKYQVNPAFMNNYYYYFLAVESKNEHNQSLDPLEEIEIELVDRDKIEQYSQFNHSAMMLGLQLARSSKLF